MKQRIITGTVFGLSTLLAIFCLKNDIFDYLVLTIVLLAAWEWSAMANAKHILSR